jgi:hypothetical protein
LPDDLAHQTYENLEHFSAKSTYYNCCFSLGAISVENGKGGGWERIRGDSAVKMNGRTHHFLPGTGSNGGLEFFTFDAASTLSDYGNSLNRDHRYGDNIDNAVLMILFHELKWANRLVHDCELIGNSFTEMGVYNDNQCKQFISRINQKTSLLDIAAVTSISRTGNRILKYQIKDSPFSSKIQMDHCLLEPLSYPLFFPWGEGGWGSNWDVRFSDYLCCRLLMPDMIRIIRWNNDEEMAEVDIMNLESENSNELFIPRFVMNQIGTRSLPVNRFQCQARLGQMYFTGL